MFNLFFYLKKKKRIITFEEVFLSERELNWRSGLVEECSYFVGNVVVQVKHIFLPDYLLVLSLLKPSNVGVFWN